jgi:hypothetical protein
MSLEENLQLRRAGQDCVGLDGVERNERISRSHVSSCLPCFVIFAFRWAIWIWIHLAYVSVRVSISPPCSYIYII